MRSGPRDDLLAIYQAALERVNGRGAVGRALDDWDVKNAVSLVAIGKAAQAMVDGAADRLGAQLRGGLVISKPGHLDRARLAQLGLEGMEGGHPMPDAISLEAGERLRRFLTGMPQENDLLFLLSGGASSLLDRLVPGLGLADLQRVNHWLIGSGFGIGDMNLVRKSLSLIKGGGLLSLVPPGRSRALLISDVPGDDPAVIGSGPLVPDPLLGPRVLALDLPEWLRELVNRGLAARARTSTRTEVPMRIVASLADARRAAAMRGRELGYAVFEDDGFRSGDAADEGKYLARQLLAGPDGLRVWGGETTVRLPDRPGRGGRNQHLALAAAIEMAGRNGIYMLAAGTDGTDGPTDDAGALVDGGTLERGTGMGLDAERVLEAADAGSFLEASGDLLNTGPTGTNVMDLMLGLKLAGE